MNEYIDGNLFYHYPSHPKAYPGGYMSHSAFIDVGLGEDLCLIQEMDAESGIQQRTVAFANKRLDVGAVELLHFEDWRDTKTGKFKKRTSFFWRWF